MLSIVALGHSHPEQIIDNAFVEGLNIGTNTEWILEKIGIHTRRTTLPVEYVRETRNQEPRQALAVATDNTTGLAVKAAQMAFARGTLRPQQIGMILCNSCTPEQVVPAQAQRIAAELGINCPAYDVQTACPAFALHLDYLSAFREDQLPDYVLCISAATMTQKVNYNDRSDAAIWGDGAAAWIVSARHPGKLRVLETSYSADPTRCEAVVVDTFGFFHQDGRAVRDFSVRQTVRLIKAIEAKYAIDWTRDIFVGHQANATMLRQITENREIPSSNHWQNAGPLGNQAGAGAPIVISQHWDEITPGIKLVVAVVGAGLSWGSVVFESSQSVT